MFCPPPEAKYTFSLSYQKPEVSEFWKQKRLWLFYYFYPEGIYDLLKPKSKQILFYKNGKLNKNEIKNANSQTIRNTKPLFQIMQELPIKKKQL